MTNTQPVPALRRESEASRFLRAATTQKNAPFLMFEVAPKSKDHVSLGEFKTDEPLIGFSLEVTPDCDPEDVAVQITKLSAVYNEYELVLHVANGSDKMVSVEVQQL